MARKALDGKPYAGNPHVRIDEGDGASARPRRSSLLYKKLLSIFASVLAAASAGAAGISAAHYVQDGLVSCFDGIDNEGTGVHNASATRWKDLKSSAYLDKAGLGFWGPSYFNCGTNQQAFKSMPIVSSYSVTLELALNLDYAARTVSDGHDVWQTLVSGGNVSFHGVGNNSKNMRWYINGSEPRINSGDLSISTLTGTSDGETFRVYRDGALANSIGDVTHNSNNVRPYPQNTSSSWTVVPEDVRAGSRGRLNASFYSFRLYNRALTADEIKFNRLIDRIRFWSKDLVGDATAVDWSTAAWVSPEGTSQSAPTCTTNDCVVIRNATANIAATDTVGLLALALETGAKLNLASDAVAATRFLFVDDQRIRAGIYTGTGAVGMQVEWLEGEGVLRVADSFTEVFPELVPPDPVEGWYEFGLRTGYKYNNNLDFKAHFVDLAKYTFPKNAKIRLVGGLILNTIPAARFGFGEVDTSGLGYVVFNQDTAFDDGRPFVIPAGAAGRYQPAKWVDQGDDLWKLTNASGDTFKGDLVVNGDLETRGDNSHLSQATFSGHLTGSGLIRVNSFSNKSRWTNPVWGFGGTLKCGSNGTAIWIRPQTITNAINELWMHSCADQARFRTNTSYCCSVFAFGPQTGGSAAAQEFRIKKLTGHTPTIDSKVIRGASDFTDLQGKRWINGCTVLVWGGNTVHAETMDCSMHVIAGLRDQQCVNGWLNSSIPTFGTGNFIVDNVTQNSQLFLSTNIESVVIGSIAGSSSIDYTFQSGAVNHATVDITNSCASTVTAKATDLAMLPARLSGFTGSVSLTDTAEKAYTIPVDLTQGTNLLYQTVGCIGSGTLAAAPATGTIDATFPTTRDALPVLGEYALARFTAGGENLANWTVTLNGAAVSSVNIAGINVKVKKDATGLWLKAAKSGVTLIFR